jgi:hypothetical protein
VRTAFDDATLIHDQDQVGVADGAETMGYDDLCTRELFQVLGDALFGDDVQITGGFVQEEYGWFVRDSAGQSESLSLSS